MIKAAGGDGVDDLHYKRHDANEVGRLSAQCLLLENAAHLAYGLGVLEPRLHNGAIVTTRCLSSLMSMRQLPHRQEK